MVKQARLIWDQSKKYRSLEHGRGFGSKDGVPFYVVSSQTVCRQIGMHMKPSSHPRQPDAAASGTGEFGGILATLRPRWVLIEQFFFIFFAAEHVKKW